MTFLSGRLVRYLSGLRFPYLAGITAVLFLANLFIPDALPFVDEILLGLGAALLSSWRKRDKKESVHPVEN